MPIFVGRLRTPQLTAAPSAPVKGEMYMDTGTNLLMFWNGTAWVSASGGSALPADTVVTAPTRIIANKLLVGDTQPSWRLLGDGKQEWGVGGTTALDTNLYRSAASSLKTDGNLFAGAALVAGTEVYAGYATATQLLMHGNGKIYFGSALDTNLYRYGADTLKTDDAFQVAGVLTWNSYALGQMGAAGAMALLLAPVGSFPTFQLLNNGYMNWGTGVSNAVYDTNLYRSLAGQLKTDGEFNAGSTIRSSQGLTNQLQLHSDGKIYFGSAADTTLSRSAAYTLRVSEILEVNQSLTIGLLNNAYLSLKHNSNAIYFGAASDTNLYRLAAAVLKTDGQFRTANEILGPVGPSSESGVRFAGDTNLFRAAAANLKIDGSLTVRDSLVAETGRLYFSAGLDTNLYRYSAGLLRTDTGFSAGGNIEGNAHVIVGDHIYWLAGSYDTNLYRKQANWLMTDDTFSVGQDLVIDQNNVGSRLYFGSALDTNLYRSAANVLQTDDQLVIPGNPTGTSPMGLVIGSQLRTYVQGTTTGSYATLFGHNVWLRADGAYLWDTTHPSFGSRAIVMDYGSGIQFYADAAAATGGATVPSMATRFRIANDGTVSAYGFLKVGGDAMNAHRHPYANNRHIESGVVNSVSVSSAVTFTNAFATAPTVCVSQVGSTDAIVSASSITTSGFTIGHNQGGTRNLAWIAEGPD